MPVGEGTVFLSHASEDEQIALDVRAALELAGVHGWMAVRDIPAAGNYGAHITAAIRASEATVVLLSEAATKSIHVQREVSLAGRFNSLLVPILVGAEHLDELDLPDAWLYWLEVSQVIRHQDADATAATILAAVGRAAPSPAALLGIEDIEAFDPSQLWNRGQRPLRVPIGTDPAGHAVELDLRSMGEGGDGPHGLIVGATGSGMSELLRTIVVSLAATHSPDDVRFALVGVWGLEELPHVESAHWDLHEDGEAFSRSLLGYLETCEERLTRFSCADRGSYLAWRRDPAHASSNDSPNAAHAEHDLKPWPQLFVMIDDFTASLNACPALMDALIAIAKRGAALGVSMVLATQWTDREYLARLRSALTFRIALRTFSTEESRAVIGTDEAASLPATPGMGFLKTGRHGPRPFSVAFSGRPTAEGRSFADAMIERVRASATVVP